MNTTGEGLENQENAPAEEINYSDLSVADNIKLLEVLESYEDQDGELKELPELYTEGVFNKELFASIILFVGPRFLLSGRESARESIDFLKKFDTRLHNPRLAGAIEYLESHLPYIDVAKDISDHAFEKLNSLENVSGEIDWFKDMKGNMDSMNQAVNANLLRAQAGILFTGMVNKVYDELWREYLIEDKNNPQLGEKKELLPQ